MRKVLRYIVDDGKTSFFGASSRLGAYEQACKAGILFEIAMLRPWEYCTLFGTLQYLAGLAHRAGMTENLVFHPMADPPYVTGDRDENS